MSQANALAAPLGLSVWPPAQTSQNPSQDQIAAWLLLIARTARQHASRS